LGYIVVAESIFIEIIVVGSERRTYFETVRNDPSRSSKVVNFDTNRKSILPRFRDIAGFLRRATPPLFHPNFRGVPFGLDLRRFGSEERRP